MTTPVQSINSERVFVTVFFKERNRHEQITMKFFDRWLHAGLITHTNNYGWFCK